MAKTAFIFPGQASQYSGMGLEVFEKFPEAADIFKRADDTLEFSLSTLCFEGDEEDLKLTENTQPAILTVSVAVWTVLRKRGIVPHFVAGHSLGEYSALVAAGTLSFEDAVSVVRLRGKYMQEAVPVGVGAMAAMVGASLDQVEAICQAAAENQVLSAANINCPGQIVVAGHREAVDRAIDMAKGQGIRKAIPLPVSAPFHCALMEPAQERLATALKGLKFSDPEITLINNAEADFITDGPSARESLIRQVTASVRWQESIERLISEGVDTFVEVGPKAVLSGMVKKIMRDANIVTVEKVDEINQLISGI